MKEAGTQRHRLAKLKLMQAVEPNKIIIVPKNTYPVRTEHALSVEYILHARAAITALTVVAGVALHTSV